MTPKEKANELVQRFSKLYKGLDEEEWIDREVSFEEIHKQSALICVDEILENFDEGFIRFSNNNAIKNKLHITSHYTLGFYKEVKEEINKL